MGGRRLCVTYFVSHLCVSARKFWVLSVSSEGHLHSERSPLTFASQTVLTWVNYISRKNALVDQTIPQRR